MNPFLLALSVSTSLGVCLGVLGVLALLSVSARKGYGILLVICIFVTVAAWWNAAFLMSLQGYGWLGR